MTTLPPLNAILGRLHLRQLRLLVALGEQRSLLRAAEQVALTQPGASKALQEIESALGVDLFSRTNRGLEPTEMGHLVVRYARLIQTDVSHMRDEMVGLLQGSGGRLSLGAIMGAVPLLTRMLTPFVEQRPDLSVEIVEDTSLRLLRLIDEGRIILAVGRSGVSEQPDRYDVVDIQNESLAVVANVAHPQMHRENLSLEELIGFRWIVYSANMPMRLLLEREFREAGLRFPSNLLETTSAFTTLSLLRSNRNWVALLSTEVARYFERSGLTGILSYQIKSRSEPYQLITRRGSILSPTALQFINVLTAQTPTELKN